MAKQLFDKATLLWGGLDLSAYSNYATIEATTPPQSVLNFASAGWEESLAGVLNANVGVRGFYDAAEPDLTMFTGAQAAFSATKTNPVVAGDIGYSTRGIITRYAPRLQIGEVAGVDLGLRSDYPLVRGVCLETGTFTATGNSAGIQQGAASATQKIYAFLHVTAASGTTPLLDLVLQSDDNAGFTSATARITFAQVSAVGWQAKELAGAVTDDYWRISRTVAGGTPSFTYRVFIGIQTFR